MKIPNVTIQQLLEAGVHLGHKTLRWNPKMKKYIFGKRDSIHIIDLTQTLELINVALENVYKVISENGKILFIFSDVLELNREILKEGSSLILTLVKNVSNDENRFRRINVQKIVSLMDLFNSSIKEVSLNIKSNDELKQIYKILKEDGKTVVNINFLTKDNVLKFKLKNARNLDRKSLNLLRKQQIQAIIA